jgi:MFS transporter, DHA1 family, multidrug resistance protein
MPDRTPPLAAYAINAAVFLATGARFLAVPLYADHLGASAAVIGILFSAYSLPAAVLAIPGGLLADRFGRRSTLLLGLLAGGVAQVLAGLSGDITVLFATQVVIGVGVGLTQVIVMASLADSVPHERLGRAMGWFAVCMQVGLLTGPAVAGLLLAASGNDFRLILVLSGAPTFVALALAVVFVRGGRRAATEDRSILGPLRDLVRRQAVWALVVALFAGTLIWGTNQGYIALLSERVYGLSTSGVGYLLAIQAIAAVLARIPAGRLVDRFEHPGRLVVPGIVGFAVCQAVLPHLSGFWAPAIVLAAGMPFSGVAMTALTVLFARVSDAGARATAMGLFSAVLYSGMAAGPALFAPAMNASFVIGFTGSAIVAMLLALLTIPALSRSRQSPQAVPAARDLA